MSSAEQKLIHAYELHRVDPSDISSLSHSHASLPKRTDVVHPWLEEHKSGELHVSAMYLRLDEDRVLTEKEQLDFEYGTERVRCV